MIGDRSYGIFNLRIQNASLDDDAEFQCQVGPAKNSDPIRTAANLTVICEYLKVPSNSRKKRSKFCLKDRKKQSLRIIKLFKHTRGCMVCALCQQIPVSTLQVDAYSQAGQHLR